MPRQPFHIVDTSPWPAVMALGALALAMGLIALFQEGVVLCLLLAFVQMVWTLGGWSRDVIRESTYLGHHTTYVARGLRMGFLLFLLSEAMFFGAIFWAFFHSALSPSPEIGCSWPPVGIVPIDPMAVPLGNTAVLVGSGVTVTWAHHSVCGGYKSQGEWGLISSVLLGVLFTWLQYGEYVDASFSMADGIYGSVFFFATGFHGLHVIIGSIFLFVSWQRLNSWQFASDRHLGLEFSVWYWHFVDVIWIFLYFCLYKWGS